MRRNAAFFILSIFVVGLGLYTLAHFKAQSDATQYLTDRAVMIARALASVSAEGDDAQTYVRSVQAKVSSLKEALVLKRTQFVTHSDPELVNTRLDRESLIHKALYDTLRAMKSDVSKNQAERANKPKLQRNPYPEVRVMPPSTDSDLWTVQVPVKVEGKFQSLAQIKMVDQAVPVSFPLGPLLSFTVATLVFLPLVWYMGGAWIGWVGVIVLGGVGFLGVGQLQTWSAQTQVNLAHQAEILVAQLSDSRVESQAEPFDAASIKTWLAALNEDAEGYDTQRIQDLADTETSYKATTSPRFLAERNRVNDRHLAAWGWAVSLLGAALFALGFVGILGEAAGALVKHRIAYAYMAPAMLGLAVLVFIPVTYGVSLGFLGRIYNTYEFVGFANYVEIVSATDFTHPRNFYFTLAVTVLWTVANISLHVSIGLTLALLLNDEMLKAKGIYRVILIVPWAIPNYVTALIWKSLFHKQFGAVNALLNSLGLEDISWFQAFWPAFSANVATNTWLGFPFMMVISLGALQSIPTDLYEAARVDGASWWQRFKTITLPLLMPALVPAVIVGTVWTFNMFNIIYLVSGGAPNGSSDILITEAFRWAFEGDRRGFAAAYSTIIFFILLAFTLVTNRITGATKGAFE